MRHVQLPLLLFICFKLVSAAKPLHQYNLFDANEAHHYAKLRREWSRNLDWHLENISNVLGWDPRVAPNGQPHWWTRFDTLGPIGPPCKQIEEFGQDDGLKWVCGLTAVTRREMQGDCRVISIGSRNEWSFERDIAIKTPCLVDTFDCYGSEDWGVPRKITSRVTFHPYCLAGKNMTVQEGDNTFRFITWAQMAEMIALDTKPVLLKIDCEGCEWEALRSVVDGSRALMPDQIAVELHYQNWGDLGISWRGRQKSAAEMIAWMDMLWRYGGYHIVARHDHGGCFGCSELLLARDFRGPPGVEAAGGAAPAGGGGGRRHWRERMMALAEEGGGGDPPSEVKEEKDEAAAAAGTGGGKDEEVGGASPLQRRRQTS